MPADHQRDRGPRIGRYTEPPEADSAQLYNRREWLIRAGTLVTAATLTTSAAALALGDGSPQSRDAGSAGSRRSTPVDQGTDTRQPGSSSPTGQASASQLSAAVDDADGKVQLPAGVFEISDFDEPANYPVYGAYLRPNITSVSGAGADHTVVQMHPYSSTKAAQVPKQSAGGVNPLALLRVDSTNLSRLTITGTPQGNLYNGLVLYQADLVVKDVTVKGIPGDSSVNPGETFSINDYRGTGNRLVRVEVDGRNVNGKRVAGSGIGANLTTKHNTTDCYVHDVAYGAGITHYKCTGTITHTRTRSMDNTLAFNFERNVATVELVDCVAKGNRARTPGASDTPVFAVVDSDLGSSLVNIRDPRIDGGTPTAANPLVIVIHPTYQGKPQAQRSSDIHLYLNGKERPDCLVIARGETLPTG